MSEQIDLNTRNLLWKRYFPKQTESLCPICGIRHISFDDFDASHIIPDGGEGIDNLVPSCRKCNDACKKKNLLIYKYLTFQNSHSTISWMPSIKSLVDEIEFLKDEISRLNTQKLNNIEKSDRSEKQQVPQKVVPENSFIKEKEKDLQISKSNLNMKHPGKANNPIIGFTYKGKEIKTYIIKDALKFICDDLVTTHKDFSEKVKTKKYFSEDPDKLSLNPYKVKNTNLYMKTNLNAKDTEIHIREMLSLFGHSQDIFKFIYRRIFEF